LGVAFLISVIVSSRIKPGKDMRGGEAVEASGAMQVQGLIAINLTIAMWLCYAIAEQLATARNISLSLF
jgi:hypothetical protein